MTTTKLKKTNGKNRLAVIFSNIKDIVAKNKLATICFLLILFLHFFKLEEFTTFLGDQGRDAIIMKRIVLLEHLPAIGAPSSVGGIFLGPFYYYIIAPFLLLSFFHPVGPAIGVATIACLCFLCMYFVTRRDIGKKTALLFLILSGFSAVLLEFSRFSWNPNLLPFFGFFSTYFFYQMMKEQSRLKGFLFGLFFGIAGLHLHYLALLTGPLYALIYVVCLFRTHDKKPKLIPGFMAAFGFLITASPLILFDIKNNFLNIKNFITLFSGGDFVTQSSYLTRFMETFTALVRYTFNFSVSQNVSLLILAGLIILFIFRLFKMNRFVLLNAGIVFWYILIFAQLNSFRHPHYFMYIFISFYLVISYIFSSLIKNKISLIAIIMAVLLFIGLNASSYLFIYKEGSRQIGRAKTIAQTIYDQEPKEPYQLITLPYDGSDERYRYFLELWNKRPLPIEVLDNPVELYVLCQAECDPTQSSEWHIDSFKNKKIATMWKSLDITIYKLIHEK